LIVEIDRESTAVNAGGLVVADQQPRADVEVKQAVDRSDLVAVAIAAAPLERKARRITDHNTPHAQWAWVWPSDFEPPPCRHSDSDILPGNRASIKGGALAHAGMHQLVVGRAGSGFFRCHIDAAIAWSDNSAKVQIARIGQCERGENFDLGRDAILSRDKSGR